MKTQIWEASKSPEVPSYWETTMKLPHSHLEKGVGSPGDNEPLGMQVLLLLLVLWLVDPWTSSGVKLGRLIVRGEEGVEE
jgi:hypothetical protein